MIKSICVFSSSSDAVAREYFEAAAELGARIARHGWTLVYGGASVGLMGALAQAAIDNGGHVVGIIPHHLRHAGIANESCHELIVTGDLRERKAAMERRADAFIALPGGFGTLEEIIEVLTLKQLALHTKPIVFVNTNGFYSALDDLFEDFYEGFFAKPEYRQLYFMAPNPADAISHIETYRPPQPGRKWF
jgi:cytokinin riboside 5'-monophosphate phosphoribohydrolase